VYVSGGGCQGFQYGMTFEEQANPDDTVVEAHGVKVFIDAQSAPMLHDAEVDYVDSLQGSGFAIKNPQAKSSCGCGNSFNA
jgi:iron-sulfur cluster insertion protein